MKNILVEKLGRWPLFITALVPIAVYSGFLFPYNSGRNFFFRALILISSACWAILWVREPARYSPRKSFLLWAILAFVAAAFASTLFSINPQLSFWSSLERMDGFISIIFLMAFFFSARALFDASSWKLFFKVSVCVALIVSFVAVLQLVGLLTINQGGVRIDATFGNALFFAAYMLLSAGISVFLATGAENKRIRVLYIFCSIVFIFLMLASASRGAFVALPAGFLAASISSLILRKENISLRKFGVWTFSILIIATGVFFIAREIPALRSNQLVNRILSISFVGQDAEARFLAWKIALKGASDSPIVGMGMEGFRYAFAKYYEPKLYGREQWFDRAHNNYLDLLVQLGALGLLAYLALLFGLFRNIWKHDGIFNSCEKIALTGMFSSYAVFNLFSFDTITASIIFFAFLAYVDFHASQNSFSESTSRDTDIFLLKNSSCSRQSRSQVPARRSRSTSFALILIIFVITLFIFYFVEYKSMRAAYLIARGLNDSSPQLDTRLGYFKKAIELNTFATSEAREFLVDFAVSASGAPLADTSRKKIVSLVFSELGKQMEIAPKDPRFPLRIGVLLNTYRRYEDAIPFIERALALSPNKQPTFYELGTSYLNLGQYEKAVDIFKRAAELLPDNEDAESKKLYAISLVYAQKFSEAKRYMKKIFGVEYFIDKRLADAYRRAGDLQTSSFLYSDIKKEEHSSE